MARKKVSIDESGESRKTEKKGTRKKKFESEKRYNMNFVPKTKNQQIAWNMFKEKSIVVLSGSAGCGKCIDYETELEIFVPDDLYDLLLSNSGNS